jgi:hypothetical protein
MPALDLITELSPYPQPDNITVFIQVNGGESYTAKLSCTDWPS